VKNVKSFLLQTAALTILLSFFLTTNLLQAQDDQPGFFIEITKIKSLNDDMMGVEKDIMFPYSQQRIKAGNQIFHGLARVRYPNGEASDYDYVVVDGYASMEHLDLSREELGKMAYEVWPNADIPAMMGRFEETAKDLGSTVYFHRDEAFPGPGGGDDGVGRFMRVNFMDVADGQHEAYAEMESKIFKPVHQAAAKAGHLNEWVLLQRVMPFGSQYEDDFVTFDIFSEWKDMGAWNDGLFAEVHPGKNADQIMEKMSSLRDLRRSEVWEIVSFTDSPREDPTVETIKEGSGASPMKGQEVVYHTKVMDMEGNVLFSSRDMGVHLVDIIGKNPYDQGFYPMLQHMQRGSVMRTTMPTSYQGVGMQNMFGNQPIILETELVDFGAAGLNGTDMLKEMIAEQGLAAARKAYAALDRAQNPEGYGFHEWDMNALGYDLMGDGHHQAAHFILEVNQQRNPKSWNACDSLADVYLAMGNVVAAADWYEKALAINPEFDAARNKLERLKP
jgi:hypothetical protein